MKPLTVPRRLKERLMAKEQKLIEEHGRTQFYRAFSGNLPMKQIAAMAGEDEQKKKKKHAKPEGSGKKNAPLKSKESKDGKEESREEAGDGLSRETGEEPGV